MKIIRAISVSIAICLDFGSCLSFRVSSTPAPEDFAVEIFLCKKIDESGDLYQPMDIASEFSQDDQNIFCFVRMKNIRKAVRLRWKWYAPDLNLFKETNDIIINAEENLLVEISAFDNITPPREGKSEGQWTVAVTMDKEFIGRKVFIFKMQLLKDSQFRSVCFRG